MEQDNRKSRRGFLGAITATTVAGALLPMGASASAPVLEQDGEHQLDQWIGALKGKYRLVVDAVSLKGSVEAVGYGGTFLMVNSGAYRLPPDASSLIIIMRNLGAPFAFNDAAWNDLKIGEVVGYDDRNGAKATRNVVTNDLSGVASQGAVVAVCGLATSFLASRIARASGKEMSAVRKQLEESLVPGGRIVPSGITTVDRCQRQKFSYAYVG